MLHKFNDFVIKLTLNFKFLTIVKTYLPFLSNFFENFSPICKYTPDALIFVLYWYKLNLFYFRYNVKPTIGILNFIIK